MRLADYQKNVKRLQFFIIAAPLLSKLFNQHSGIPFPPMGDETTLFRFFAMLIVGTSAALPFVVPFKRRSPWIAVGLLCALVVSSAVYLTLEQHYVVTISFSASEKHPDGAKAFVTRGSQRNPDLKEPYASMKDDDLIRYTGLTDARLERGYMRESLIANRRKLFWAYVLPLIWAIIYLAHQGFSLRWVVPSEGQVGFDPALVCVKLRGCRLWI